MPKVLIVEDDREIQRIYVRILTDFELIQAHTWDEGLQMFQEHADSLDAIVLDGHLGGKYGDTLAQAIRDAGYTGPMIAASHAFDIQRRLLKSGCDHEVEFKILTCDLLKKLLL